MPRARPERIIPVAPVDRLIRKAGARRVSEGAGERLAQILEEIALDFSRQAITIASHAGRSTVTQSDFDVVLSLRGSGGTPQKI